MARPALLVVDKPVGPTSHDVVNMVRRGTHIRKAGHTGTLDPSASGVLVVLLGGATRLAEYLLESDKEYEAVVRFGQATSTHDAAGQVTACGPVAFTRVALEQALACFEGESLQTPPAYSAVKIQGRKAYELARKGEVVDLEPRMIRIYRIELLGWEAPQARIRVRCSRGTYLRSLARDLGERLGSPAHLGSLRRLRLGPFTIDQAIALDELQAHFTPPTWPSIALPATAVLHGWPVLELTPEQVVQLQRGMAIEAAGARGRAQAVAPDGELVAIVEADPEGRHWLPRKVLTEV
ncbi:MAG: tRNA pseudouridine(55) synthase TruB [Chloroflexi bacterium]|nr:tRNA pseudouridine(55) synthase TruB [Chloroflexota bacterium]